MKKFFYVLIAVIGALLLGGGLAFTWQSVRSNHSVEYSKSSSSSTSAHSKKSSVEFSSSSEVSASSNVSSAESQIGEYRSVQNGSSSGDKVVSGVTITADEIAKGRAEIYQIDENAANAMSNGDIAQMIIAARQEGKSLRVYFNEKR